MSIQEHDTIRILNRLISICRGGCSAFALASGAISAPELSRYLNRFARERLVFASDLVTCVHRMGGEVEAPSSGLAATEVQQLAGSGESNDPRTILSDCEWNEEDAMESYRDAMTRIDDPNVRELVTEQFVSLKVTRDTLRALRELLGRRTASPHSVHADNFATA